MTTTEMPLEQARRVLRLMPRLHRWAATSVQANRVGPDLSLRQLGALFQIREGMTSPGQLARRLWVTPAVVTGLLDRLEQQGYLRREPDPHDRRRLRVALTEAGLSTSQAVAQALAEELATQFAETTPAELAELDRALDVLERALAALEAHVPASADMWCGVDPDAAWETPGDRTLIAKRGVSSPPSLDRAATPPFGVAVTSIHDGPRTVRETRSRSAGHDAEA